jgi:hypothetical protein
MRLLFLSAQHICLSIWLVAAMRGASDSGACAPRAARECDSEVVQTGSIFGYATDGVRHIVSIRLAEIQVLITFADHT